MHPDTVLSGHDLRVLWHELSKDEQLVDPYELTEHGEVVMSPRATNRHQIACSIIAGQLKDQLGGLAVVEAAMVTATAGVRVPDVVWMPDPRWTRIASGADLVEGPDLVVEVLSPGNRPSEVSHKVQAYLASGVREVIVVGLDGSVVFHRTDGLHLASALGVQLRLPPELFT